MTSKNRWMHSNEQGRWAHLVQDVEPSEELVEKTVDAMRLAAAAERPARHMATPARRVSVPLFSRRGFVALGGACAAAAAIAVVAPLTQRDSAPDEPLPVEPHSFGLAIAQAAEPGHAVVIEAADGELLLPVVGDDTFRASSMRFNLSCVGEGVERLTFTLLDVPTQTFKGTRPFDPEEIVKNLVYFQRTLLDCDDGEVWEAWSATEEMAHGGQEISVDLLEELEWNGMYETSYGPACDVLWAVTPEDALWGQDPVMAAKNAWIVAGCTEPELISQETVDELCAAYIDAYEQVSATPEEALAWSRKCYVGSKVLAAAELNKAVLHVKADFADGSTAVKCYRIGTVDNFEEAMGGRYDALYDLRSEEPDLSWPGAPCCSFAEEYHDASEDPRLAVPLFTITDVTDVEADAGDVD